MRRPVALLILTLLCFGSPVSISARDRSRAIELNDQGFELYEEGRFTEALELFEAAWRADDQYVYGHYNYACTLAILVREEPALWYYERDSAFEHLERTLELRPGYREKMLVDPDLSELRREFRFYSVLGFEVTDADDLAFILTTLPWYGAPTSGIYPYTAGAEFYSDGSVRFWFYTPAWFESFDEADIYRVGGSWTAQDGGVIRIELDAPMQRRRTLEDIVEGTATVETQSAFSGSLSADGELSFEIFDFSFRSVYERFSA